MISQHLMNDFTTNHLSTRKIAEKYNIERKKVLFYLRNTLGKNELVTIAKRNAAITTNILINRKALARKIKNTINRKMKYKSYREKWILKTKQASKLAREKVNILLEEKTFRNGWINNCRKGGIKSVRLQKGIFNPKYKEKRIQWSIKGLNNTKRKIVGPNNEMMYNVLERQVAEHLSDLGIAYEYEKRFRSNNLNGFISCDFVIRNKKYIIFIETTCWDDPKEKSNELIRKSKVYKNLHHSSKFIIITTTQTIKEKYKKYLKGRLKILTIQEFKKKEKNSAGWI